MTQVTVLNSFGLKCRALRIAAGRRLIDQADALKMEPAEIAEFETGQSVPSEQYIRTAAYWLRVSPQDLEALLIRIPIDGLTAKFSREETRALRNSRRLLDRASDLSASILKIDQFRRKANDGPPQQK